MANELDETQFDVDPMNAIEEVASGGYADGNKPASVLPQRIEPAQPEGTPAAAPPADTAATTGGTVSTAPATTNAATPDPLSQALAGTPSTPAAAAPAAGTEAAAPGQQPEISNTVVGIVQNPDGTITTGVRQVTPATPENGQVIDPEQLVRRHDGTYVKFRELDGGTMLKSEYDRKLSEVKQIEANAQQLQQELQRAKPWLDLAASDQFATTYLTVRKGGGTPAQARAAAMEAIGESQVVNPQSQQPAQPGTPQYYRTGYQQLGLTPGMPEHDEWLAGHIAARAEDATTAIVNKAFGDRDQREQQRMQEEQLQQQQAQQLDVLFEQNKQVVGGFREAIKSMHNFDPALLPPQQQEMLTAEVDRLAREVGLQLRDPEWMRTNVVSDREIKLIARSLNLQPLLQPGNVGQPAPARGGAPTQPASLPNLGQPPTLIQAPLAPNPPGLINASPPGSATPPIEEVTRELSDNENLEGALNELMSGNYRQ